MMKAILKRLSPELLEKIVKSQFKVPDLAFDPNFKVKIASTKDELEDAYKLLHDCYVNQGLMKPHPSGLRCTLYTFLPETVTIVVKYKEKTVGTVTLIKDSRLGLPTDEKYQKENDKLRAQGCRLIEVSSLAVSKEFRSTGHVVQLLLIKYLYHYSLIMGGTSLVISVHPRAKSFYRALLEFEQFGNVVQYDYVNGALAIYMRCLITSTESWARLASSFKSGDYKRNMAMWLINYMDDRFIFPKLHRGQVLSPVLSPDLMEYFFVKKTSLLKELSIEKRRVFFEILIHFFGESEISRFKEFYSSIGIKEYRMAVDLTAGLEVNNQFYIVNIFDLSTNGAFIEASHDPHFRIKKGDKVIIRFKIGRQSFHIESMVMWMKTVKDINGPIGFGLKFCESYPEIKHELQTFDDLEIAEAA